LQIISWNTETEELIGDFREDQPLFCIEFNQKNRQLVSGNLKGEITIQTLSTNFKEQKRAIIQAHNGIVRTIKFINETYFASGAEDNKVKIWNIENNQCVLEFEHQNFVQSLEIINGKLLSASYDGSIITWDLDINS
jgi:WD40 repeat protein